MGELDVSQKDVHSLYLPENDGSYVGVTFTSTGCCEFSVNWEYTHFISKIALLTFQLLLQGVHLVRCFFRFMIIVCERFKLFCKT